MKAAEGLRAEASSDYDFIIVSHSEVVHHEKYRKMPLDRIDLFRNLVQLRMVYEDGGFLSHLDVLNKIVYGKCFDEASEAEKRKMFSVWNLPSFNGMLAINQLVEADYKCKVINNFDAELDLLKEWASKTERPIIGISSTFILQWLEVGRISKILRSIAPNAILVLGGAFVNDHFLTKGKETFEKYLDKYDLDYIVYSFNSEKDLLGLIKCLKEGGDLKEVNNLAYRNEAGEFVATKDVWNEPVVNFPAKAWARLYNPENMGTTLQLRTTSGCPFSCAFCTYPVTAGGFTSSDVEFFEKQLEAIDALGCIKRIIIIDDTPNVPLARFRKIVSILKKYNFKWHSFLRVQYMDDALAKDMADSGCDGVYLGIESANDDVLKSMNKKVTVADYRRGIAQLKAEGITTFAAFVLGFPGETPQTIDDNIKFIEETGLEFYSLKEFYYMHTASIHKKKDEWNLTGHGNVWSHKTMTSVEASEQKLRIFNSVKSAVHIDSDSGLWYLAYLRECGFEWQEIKDIQNLITEMMMQDNRNDFFSKGPLMVRMREILEKANFKNKPAQFKGLRPTVCELSI